jgi:hypothetical protein
MNAYFLVALCLSLSAISHAAESVQEIQFSVYLDESGKSNDVKFTTGIIDPNANAYGSYAFNSSMNGWNYLDINANKSPLNSKAHLSNMFALGYAEGFSTCKEIHTFWPNFYKDLFGDLSSPPGIKTLKFIKDQWDWMGIMIEKHSNNDSFWFSQLQTRRQLSGMLKGYNDGCLNKKTTTTLHNDNEAIRSNKYWNTFDTPSLEHLLLINAWGDLYQITVKMKEPGRFSRYHGVKKDQLVERCSAFVRLLPDNSDIYFGHNTWDSFESLGPRVFKKYNFPLFSETETSTTEKGIGSNNELTQYSTLFSSSPALISSIDDFFVVKGRGHLGVQETTNSLYNIQVLNTITPLSILSWQRSTSANQLASNGKEWTNFFATNSSGTYTNQWMIIDFNKFQSGVTPPATSDLFWVYEEVPGLNHSEDMTTALLTKKYWPSYNSPYFQDIRDRSGYQRLCDAGITGDCYDLAPRSLIFKQQYNNVIDNNTMKNIMRYNMYQEDKASEGNGCHTIACRGDLQTNPDNIGAFGALDAKMSSIMMNKGTAGADAGVRCNAVLGPTTDKQKPFCWSNIPNESDYSHLGQPDCFDFDWIQLGDK